MDPIKDYVSQSRIPKERKLSLDNAVSTGSRLADGREQNHIDQGLAKPAESVGFFSLPRECRDRIYTYVISTYEPAGYMCISEPRAKDSTLTAFKILFDDGIEPLTPAKRTAREEAVRKKEEQMLGYYELDSFIEDYGEMDTLCPVFDRFGRAHAWLDDPNSLIEDWSYNKVHPRLDTELQQCAHKLVKQTLKYAGYDENLFHPPETATGKRDVAVLAFLGFVQKTPFMLHDAAMLVNKEIPLILFFTGDFLETVPLNRACKRQDFANTGIRNNAYDASEQLINDKSFDDTSKSVAPYWPFDAPTAEHATRETWRDPEISRIESQQSLNDAYKKFGVNQNVYRLDGTFKILVTETTVLHLNKLWDFEVEFEKNIETRTGLEFTIGGACFWMNLWNGQPNQRN